MNVVLSVGGHYLPAGIGIIIGIKIMWIVYPHSTRDAENILTPTPSQHMDEGSIL